MDELTVMQGFRAERVKRNPVTRAAAWRLLEARFEPAPAGAATLPARRLGGLLRRRRLIAFAGATALAAVLAGVLVLSSGPTAQPAAAEVLRQTAAVAARAEGPSGIPGPGQFLYMKTERSEFQEWVPGSYTATAGGLTIDESTPRGAELAEKGSFTAFVPWQEEEWVNTDEESRTRWVMGTLRFPSAAERSRWERAGSPLPGPFDGAAEKRGFPGARILEARRGVMDVEGQSGAGFTDFSKLPTEPKALRLAIEHRQAAGLAPDYGDRAKPLDEGQVIAELWDILDKPNGTSALRAAVFGALAEEPGIELNRNAKDLAGRPGYALSYEKPASSSSEYQLSGFRVEYVFDPETSQVLGKREVVGDPARLPWPQRPAAGTVIREVAYLDSGIVSSTAERPHERGGEPVATTDPTYRK